MSRYDRKINLLGCQIFQRVTLMEVLLWGRNQENEKQTCLILQIEHLGYQLTYIFRKQRYPTVTLMITVAILSIKHSRSCTIGKKGTLLQNNGNRVRLDSINQICSQLISNCSQTSKERTIFRQIFKNKYRDSQRF